MSALHTGGTWYVMPTAFSEDLHLDEAAQKTLTESVLAWGVDGIMVLGVMGEAAALTTEERAGVIRSVVGAAGGSVPIAVGCSAASATTAAAHAQQAAHEGAEFAMVAAPPLLRNLDTLPAFFGQVSEQGELPVIVQDEPAATGVTLPVSTIVDCLKAAESSVVKLEDPPTGTKISALLDVVPDAAVFGGLGGAAAYYELARGAVGTMTGFSYPEILAAIRLARNEPDRVRGFELFWRYLPLISFEAQPVVGLGIRKELLRRRGVLRCPTVRIGPGVIDAHLSHELDEVLTMLGLAPSPTALKP